MTEQNKNGVKVKAVLKKIFSPIKNGYKKIKGLWLFSDGKEKMGGGKRTAFCFFNVFLLIAAGVVIGLTSLLLAYGTAYPHEFFYGYLSNPYILMLNLVPPVLLMLVFYGLIGRGWIACIVDSVLVTGLSVINFYLLRFRGDPVMFSDVLYIREAAGISKEGYDYSLSARIVFCIAVCVFVTLLLFLFQGMKLKYYVRIPVAIAVLALVFPLKGLYFDDEIYDLKTKNCEHIDRWSATRIYVSKGFVYPFIHSIKTAFPTPPPGYDQEEAIKVLSDYTDKDIPENKKVDVIAVMLEAFCDLEETGIQGINPSVYNPYRKLEQKSVTGTLVTNIFAGGTIDSERAFLTGYQRLDNYRHNVNSYVRYFNDQGYFTDGGHPSQDWFYNRKNVNNYIGFNEYRFSENYYLEKYGENMRLDSVAFPDIYDSYKKAKKENGKPYFGFFVTYQGHGPYATDSFEWGREEIFDGTGISEQSDYILDNYLGSVSDTSWQIDALVQQLEKDENPIVLLLFGDHKPWLGDSHSVYNELGINLNVSSADGFANYYNTEYVIFANEAAKKALGKDFAGEGPVTSPCFLMSVLFDEMGLEGNSFMQYSRNVRKHLPALNSVGTIDSEGNFNTLGNLSAFHADVYNGFMRVAYYKSTVFDD